MITRLDKVSKGKRPGPRKFFIYGPAGLGKTTLAADAPAAIGIDIDDGSGNIDVARYPFDDAGRVVPQSYEEFLTAIDDLIESPHEYKTLFIDTFDKLEAMIHKYMLARDSKSKAKARNESGGTMTCIEDYGYGKGYTLAVDEIRALLLKLDELRTRRGVSIILIAHSQVKAFKNPTGEDFDRYIPKINEKAFGVIKEWADVVGFMNLDTLATDQGLGDRARGISTGARVLFTQPHAAYEAKARGLMLADRIIVPQVNPWSLFASAIATSDNTTNDGLIERINEKTTAIGDAEYLAKVKGFVDKYLAENNREALIKILEKVTQRLQEKEGNANV